MEAPKVIWVWQTSGWGDMWRGECQNHNKSQVFGKHRQKVEDFYKSIGVEDIMPDKFIRADAPELVALVDALRETRKRMLSALHWEFDDVWLQSDFDDESKPADDALAAWEALTNG